MKSKRVKSDFFLRKVVYLYECMDDWKKFNEISLLEEVDFYSKLNMDNIADADHAHSKRVCKEYQTENNFYINNFYIQSDTLLLAD